MAEIGEVIEQIPNILQILDIVDWFIKQFGSRLTEILPEVPAISDEFITQAEEYMGYLNWFFPVGHCVTFLGAVLACISVYYGSKVVLKRMGVI